MSLYFAADLHLGHKNVIRFDGRPWNDLEEHDTEVICRTLPLDEDQGDFNELWLMGDVGWRRHHVERLLKAIRPHWSKIHLIRGNHDDKAAWKCRHLFDSAHEARYIRVDERTRIYLSHYALRTWRGSNRGSIHIHGHSHGALLPWGRSYDAFIGLNDYRPIRLDNILDRIKDQPVVNHHEDNHREVLLAEVEDAGPSERISFYQNGVMIGSAFKSDGRYRVHRNTHDPNQWDIVDTRSRCWDFLLRRNTVERICIYT